MWGDSPEAVPRLPDDPTKVDFSSRKRHRLAQGCIVLVYVGRLFRAACPRSGHFRCEIEALEFRQGKARRCAPGGSGEPPHIMKKK